MLQNIAKRNNF